MAGIPILTRAETAMASLIGGMKTTDGFNFDWGDVNQQDLAKVTKFPMAVITLEPEEENLDDLGGAHANSYLNRATFKIRAVGKLPTEVPNNIFAINEVLMKELDDLKKLFGTGAGYNLNGSINSMQYRRSSRPLVETGDIFIPKELESFWTVMYAQDRVDPTKSDADP